MDCRGEDFWNFNSARDWKKLKGAYLSRPLSSGCKVVTPLNRGETCWCIGDCRRREVSGSRWSFAGNVWLSSFRSGWWGFFRCRRCSFVTFITVFAHFATRASFACLFFVALFNFFVTLELDIASSVEQVEEVESVLQLFRALHYLFVGQELFKSLIVEQQGEMLASGLRLQVSVDGDALQAGLKRGDCRKR